EHHRRVADRSPDESFVHVTLASGPVAEVDDRGLAVLANRSVALDPHRVAGRVQSLRADHDRVEVEVVLLGVPAAMADAAVELEQLRWVDTAAPGDAVLTVGREGHVAGVECAARADLRGLLAEQRGPDAELSLPLEGNRLEIDPPGQNELTVRGLDLLGRQLKRVVRMLGPVALGCQQLDQLRLAGTLIQWGGSGGSSPGSFDGHVPLLTCSAPPACRSVGVHLF